MQLTKRSSAIVVVEEGGDGVRRAEELVEGGAGVAVEGEAEVAGTACRGAKEKRSEDRTQGNSKANKFDPRQTC